MKCKSITTFTDANSTIKQFLISLHINYKRKSMLVHTSDQGNLKYLCVQEIEIQYSLQQQQYGIIQALVQVNNFYNKGTPYCIQCHACTTKAHANNRAHTESLAPYTNPKSTYKVLIPHTESNSLSRFQDFSDYNERDRGRTQRQREE